MAVDNPPPSDADQAEAKYRKLFTGIAIFICGYGLYLFTEDKKGFWYELIHHAGLFAATVVLVHFVYDIWIKKHEQRILKVQIQKWVSEVLKATVDEVLPSAAKLGISGFCDELDISSVFRKLKAGDELLWLDIYSPNRIDIQTLLKEALNKGVKIKMLVMAPTSSMAELRIKELSPSISENEFRHDLDIYPDALLAAVNQTKHKDKFELRLYDDLPCMPIYIHLREGRNFCGLNGFYLTSFSEKCPHIMWEQTESGMLDKLRNYFLLKWANAQPYTEVSFKN